MRDDNAKIAGAFLLGGLIGASIALLYAPKSGRETRRDITNAARQAKKRTVDLIDDTIENINDFAEDVKDRATEIIERGVELSESAKKEVISTLEHGQKTIEKQKKRLVSALGL